LLPSVVATVFNTSILAALHMMLLRASETLPLLPLALCYRGLAPVYTSITTLLS
jgi:hypothetical protein